MVDGIKVILTVVVSTVTATVTATWTIRGMVDEHDKRITISEQKMARVENELVPRKEHEIHWTANDAVLRDMKDDVRDIRTDIKTILRKP